MLPHCDTAVAIAIDMPIGIAWYPAVHLENFGLKMWVTRVHLHSDGEFSDWARSRRWRPFDHQIAAFDQDVRAVHAGGQFGLIEGNRGLYLIEREQGGGNPMP